MIVSIDIETTGLDPDKHQVLEIAAVIDKGELNVDNCEVIHCYVVHEEVVGNLYALNMNKEAIDKIFYRHMYPNFTFLKPENVAEFFDSKLPEAYTVAGANFANFDARFLRKLGWTGCWHYRIMDVGNLFYQPSLDGEELPGLDTCLARAGLGPVKHNAIDDAKDVLRLIRNLQ